MVDLVPKSKNIYFCSPDNFKLRYFFRFQKFWLEVFIFVILKIETKNRSN
jgi:hypothetical protein